MSQRPPASRPVSRSPPDGPGITLPPVQLREDVQEGARKAEPSQAEQLEGRAFPSHGPPLLPSQYGRPRLLQPAPSGEDWRSGTSRDLGVHSILNPTEPESTPSSRRQMSRAQTESPIPAVGFPQYGASPSTAPQHTFPGQQPAVRAPPIQPGYSATFPRGRPILIPRSPRSVSAGRGRGQETIDASILPFLTGRTHVYTAEPGQSGSSEVPPMPTPPGQTQSQQHYGFTPPAVTPRRTSNTMQAPGRTSHSQSASPSISQSSQNLSSSQTTPASNLYKGGPPTSTQGFLPGPILAPAGLGGQAGTSSTTEGPYSAPRPLPPSQQQAQPGSSSTVSSASASAPSSRQTSASDPIQVLTITDLQGTVYNVPVDVHQASRLADEKRARNAGASARFRHRRKEKEREANTTIEKMQNQNRDLERKVRELEQERDFYRTERDRFRDVVLSTPDMRHLAPPAPPSPQTMRSSSLPGPRMALGGPPPPIPAQQGQTVGFQVETPQERAPRRRRTDTSGQFASVPYTLPPTSTLPPVAAAGYPPGAPNLPPLRMEKLPAQQNPTTTSGPGNAPAMTAGPPPPPFDLYARGPPGPYERGWPSERGGRR